MCAGFLALETGVGRKFKRIFHAQLGKSLTSTNHLVSWLAKGSEMTLYLLLHMLDLIT